MASTVYSFPQSIVEADIGRLVSRGKQHLVYTYQDDWVIKVPRQTWFMQLYGLLTPETLQRDLFLLQQYFEPYLAATQILPHEDTYCILQQRIQGRPIRAKESPSVREQLRLIWSANAELKREHGLFLDVFGFLGITTSSASLLTGGLISPRMTNMLVDESSNRILIVDTNLSTTRQRAGSSLAHTTIDWWNVTWSQYLAEKQFLLPTSNVESKLS